MTSVSGVGESTANAVNSDAAKHHKLVDAAQQFEAIFLNEMLKGSFGTEENGDGEQESGAGGTMKSIGVEAMSKAIASAGGMGVAKQLVSKVEAQSHELELQKKFQTALKSF